jgi:ketosteroid isomerase-like protein
MAQVITGLDTAQVAAIRTARDRQLRLIRAADWNSLVRELYTDDAVVMPSNTEPLDTPAKIRKYCEDFPKLESISITNVEIDGRADLAWERGRFELKASGVTDRGSHLTLWRRQSDGTWRIFRDIWHSDLPAAK